MLACQGEGRNFNDENGSSEGDADIGDGPQDAEVRGTARPGEGEG